MFGTAGHSVVYQGTASPGLSDASIGKHLFVSFLLFAGPTWAIAARAPPLPLGLGIKVILIQPPASYEEAFRVFSVALVTPRLVARHFLASLGGRP